MAQPTKQELIAEILRVAPKYADEAILQQKTVEQLSGIIREIGEEIEQIYEESFENRLQIQAKGAAVEAIHRLRLKQEHDEADAKQLPIDRQTFAEAAKQSKLFGINEANFSIARNHLGPAFHKDVLLAAAEAGIVMLAPPSQSELDMWRNEAIQKYQTWLKTEATPDQIRAAAKQENQIRAEQQQMTGFEKELSDGYYREVVTGGKKKLPTHWRGKPLDKTTLRQADKEGLRELIRLYGSAQVSARIHGVTRVPDGNGGWYHFQAAEAA